jgi:general secretion pathway protein J
MNRPRQTSRRARAGGFTLVELLVVISLLSLVMLALGAAMRTMAQSELRIDQRLARADEMRVATGFLATAMGRISNRKSLTPPPAGASPFLFSGAPEAATWVGVMPARYGAGGRYFFRLARETNGAEAALVIRFAPWAAGAGFPDWNTAESRVLVTQATRLALEYAEPEGGGSWLPQWSNIERLPTRVRVSVRTAAGDWPPLVFALRAMPGGDGGRGGFSLGPE